MSTNPTTSYFLPSLNLKSVVHHYEWHNCQEITNLRQVVVLPSLSVGILFYFNNKNTFVLDRSDVMKVEPVRSVLIPPNSTPIIDSNFNQFNVLRIIFLPGKMTQLFEKSMSLFRNVFPDASLVLDRKIKDLHQSMNVTSTPEEKIQLAEKYIFSKLRHTILQPTLFSRIALELPFLEERNRFKVQALASKIGKTRQHFNLVCKREFGFSAKLALSILRFNKTLTHLHACANVSLAQTAMEFGYNDQAHLCHEFKKMIGTSPKKYLNSIREKRLYGKLTEFHNTGLLIEKKGPHSIFTRSTTLFTRPLEEEI